MNFETIKEFEIEVAKFFGAPYAVAVDCCTHGVELSLRLLNTDKINVPVRTYLSIPMLADKLGIKLEWRDEEWLNYYTINYGERRVIDAAVLWKKNSYVPNSLMSVSFQFQKHLSLGRGGIILLDNEEDTIKLKKMSYDGRLPNAPWKEQNIDTMGYHYYMTPETAYLGLSKLDDAIKNEPRQWIYTDWPDLRKMKIFNKQ